MPREKFWSVEGGEISSSVLFTCRGLVIDAARVGRIGSDAETLRVNKVMTYFQIIFCEYFNCIYSHV